MMADSLPFCGPMDTLSGWELEAWYEDLQDILWPDTKEAGGPESVLAEQELVQVEDVTDLWTIESLGSTLPVELNNEDAVAIEAAIEQLPPGILELLNSDIKDNCSVYLGSPETESAWQIGPSEHDSSCCSSSVHTHTEDEEPCVSQIGSKRKRTSQSRGVKRVKEKDQENESKVAHLLAENERLKGEIERLTKEVEQTRKSLIDRMVNLKKA